MQGRQWAVFGLQVKVLVKTPEYHTGAQVGVLTVADADTGRQQGEGLDLAHLWLLPASRE